MNSNPVDVSSEFDDTEGLTTRVLRPIERAQTRVEREQTEVAAEKHAFAAFVDRVEAIEGGITVPSAGGRGVRPIANRSTPLAQIRDVYRETVMAVEHYDREYGESLQNNLRAELGADVSTAVCGGSAQVFPPQLKEAIIGAAQQATQERAALLDTLDGEATSLTDAQEVLSSLIAQLEDHTRRHSMSIQAAHGEAIDERLEAVVRDRQQLLHTRSDLTGRTGHDLCEYLYRPMGRTYPVLWAAALLRDFVASRQQ